MHWLPSLNWRYLCSALSHGLHPWVHSSESTYNIRDTITNATIERTLLFSKATFISTVEQNTTRLRILLKSGNLLSSDSDNLWQWTRGHYLGVLKRWTYVALLLARLNSWITSTIISKSGVRDIELIQWGAQPLVVCEVLWRNGMRSTGSKRCVCDAVL
jgi:hypothetical protein